MTQTATLADHTAITLSDRDRTRPYLVLHGGGGPDTVRSFADLLAERTRSRVLVPTHPGFAGTDRPAGLTSTRHVAAAYVALLEELDLTEVTVIGNSFGGWIASEMALLGTGRLANAVIVNGVGIDVAEHPMTDIVGLPPADLATLSFHDPSKAPQAPAGAASPTPNVAALLSYTGPTMSDPTLAERLADITLPVHVIWGESDGIVDLGYGQAWADAIRGSTFTPLPEAGHMPQLETPEALLRAIPSARA